MAVCSTSAAVQGIGGGQAGARAQIGAHSGVRVCEGLESFKDFDETEDEVISEEFKLLGQC